MEQNRFFFAGIDVGSTSTDGVLIDENGGIIERIILPTGASIADTLTKCRQALSRDGQCNFPTAATGYGRKRLETAQKAITEITAHALGAFHQFGGPATVIDMGGQDTKIIRVNAKGGVLDFAMNDKCAAGTGRFLEVMAGILEMDLNRMGILGAESKEASPITSTCTVFVESEIISLIAEGTPPDWIAAGVFASIAGRIRSMVSGISAGPPFILSGGVAKNPGIVSALSKILPGPILTPEDPQLTGALGAALFIMKHKG